jgi:hypothetical protein
MPEFSRVKLRVFLGQFINRSFANLDLPSISQLCL